MTLSNIYCAYDRESGGVGTATVDLASLVSGFSLFSAGSKSHKLALAFHLFTTTEAKDADAVAAGEAEEGAMVSLEGLALFLRAGAQCAPYEDSPPVCDPCEETAARAKHCGCCRAGRERHPGPWRA